MSELSGDEGLVSIQECDYICSAGCKTHLALLKKDKAGDIINNMIHDKIAKINTDMIYDSADPNGIKILTNKLVK